MKTISKVALAAALLEGVGMLTEGTRAVLVVYADETPPPQYQVYVEPDQPVFALGMLLTAAHGKPPRYRLTPVRGAVPALRPEVALMEFLLEDAAVARLDAGKPGWQLERVGCHA